MKPISEKFAAWLRAKTFAVRTAGSCAASDIQSEREAQGLTQADVELARERQAIAGLDRSPHMSRRQA